MFAKPKLLGSAPYTRLDVSQQKAIGWLVQEFGPITARQTEALWGEQFPEVDRPSSLFGTLLSQAARYGYVKAIGRGVYAATGEKAEVDIFS